MELFDAIKGRRSCRQFLPDPLKGDEIEKILDAAVWAPSPLNSQPWEFLVITGELLKEKIHSSAEESRQWAIRESGWKWLEHYRVDFLKQAPVLVCVVGDPAKTGVDMFMAEGSVAYQHACAAAIQNMHLAAYSLGLSTLWFTLFDKAELRDILGIDPEKNPVGIVCIGRADGEIADVPRKDAKAKTCYL